MELSGLRWLNQDIHSNAAFSTAPRNFHGER